MHNRLFEIRNGRPFTEEEIKNGVCTPENFLDVDGVYADYIVPSEFKREDDFKFLDGLPFDVLTRDGNRLLFHQSRYDAFVEDYVSHVKSMAVSLTPDNFYPAKAGELGRWLKFQPDYMDTYVYYDDSEEFLPIHEFLMYAGEYRDSEYSDRCFYIGKAYDFHW